MSTLKAIRLLLALTCEESTRFMSDSSERELSRVQRWAVRLHFISCKPCRRFRKQLIFLHEAIRERARRATGRGAALLSPSARSRITQRIVEARVD